jgi:hypothetical protein
MENQQPLKQIKKLKGRTNFSFIFMYFIAPFIWGIWISFRLKMIPFDMFLRAILSPVSVAVLLAFFMYNRIHINKLLNAILNDNTNEDGIKNAVGKIMKTHLISIALFGTIGTFICMLTLKFPFLVYGATLDTFSVHYALTGSFAGAALTLIFFNMFSYMLMDAICKMANVNNSNSATCNFKKYLMVSKSFLIAGIFFLFLSAIMSFAYSSLDVNALQLLKHIQLLAITLVVPVFLGTFLSIKWTNKTLKTIF